MGLLALIGREPRVRMDEWLSYVGRNVIFVRVAARVAPNPFKPGQMMRVEPAVGAVHIVLNNAIVGAIHPSDCFGENGEFEVYATAGNEEAVSAVASEAARALGATVAWVSDP